MAVYAGTTELQTRLQRIPNLPIPPKNPDQVVSYLEALDRAIADFHDRLAERLQQFVEIASTTEFGAAETSVAVVFGTEVADDSYVVVATPGWDARMWVTAVSTAGFTLNASSAPGGAGGSVRWAVLR